jgi:hypothetical protein
MVGDILLLAFVAARPSLAQPHDAVQLQDKKATVVF